MKIFSGFLLLGITLLSINHAQAQGKKELSVESIWAKFEFWPSYAGGFSGMADGEHFTKINDKNGYSITKHSFKNYQGKGEVLVDENDLKVNGKTLEVDNYTFSPDESMMLLTSNRRAIYRRSFAADYFVLDLKTKKLTELAPAHKGKTLADFSPDGKKVAFISENNLYVQELSNQNITQVTSDGARNKIINGTTDWVYEEEFSLTKAFCWSPDGSYLAYLRFDESAVRDFSMDYYTGLYPEQYVFKYPKAGENNSVVSCHLFNLNTSVTTKLNLGDYEYIPRLKWSPIKNQLILLTLNRHQNELKYHLVDATTSEMVNRVIFIENSDTYVDIDDNLIILNDGKSLLRTSEISGYNHIYQLQFDGNSRQITKGNWDVIEFLGVDEKNKLIYYSSAEKGAIHKGLYRIKLDGSAKSAISSETGHNDADFVEGMKYFMKTYSNANTPAVFTLCDASGKEIAILEDNTRLKNQLKEYTLSPKEFLQIDGAAQKLNASIIKPANFDPTKKYPVYVHIYGGPGSNTVADEYDGNEYIWHQLLAQKGYIVFSVDPRGTMYQGAKFKKSTYLQLGKLETEDFIAAAKYLGSLPYVDASRIGIQGWSYGGYMTSLAMTKGADYFKMGIAVAPVTNWRFYDNIYTERFMRTPQENASGYDDNSPINHVGKLKGKYLLIHGSADDNVHYQNTMEMISALTEKNKQFDLFIYPDKNHGIYGGNTRNHLFTMILNYTLKNL